jgi:hypothetical protein
MQASESSKKTKELLITFATEKEARGTIDALKARQEGDLFVFERGAIFITGMSSLAAAVNLAQILSAYEEIWNIGLAGSFTKEEGLFPIGSITKFLFMPETTSLHSRTFFVPPPLILGTGKKLITSDFPIHDQTLSLNADLVDMEGYGVALLCQKMQKKLKMWKIVSDFAEKGGEERIRAYIEALSLQMACFIKGML